MTHTSLQLNRTVFIHNCSVKVYYSTANSDLLMDRKVKSIQIVYIVTFGKDNYFIFKFILSIVLGIKL